MDNPTNSDPSPITNTPDTLQTQPIQTPVIERKKTNFVVLVLLVTLFISIGILVYILLSFNLIPKQNITNQQLNSTSTTEDKKDTISYLFVKSGEVWSLNNNEETKQITNTGGQVSKYAYSKTNNMLAYMLSKKDSRWNTQQYSIHILNLNTQYDEEVWGLEPSESDKNTEYLLQLQDLKFANHKNVLIFTTSDAIYTYNIEQRDLDTMYHKPFNEQSGLLVFAYRNILVSPDDKKIIVTKQYYEGSGQILVNLENKNLQDLNYSSGYTFSQKAISWIDENTFLMSGPENETSEMNNLYKVNANTLIKEKTIIPNSSPGDFALQISNELYYLARQAPIPGVENSPLYIHIYKLDLSKKTLTEIGFTTPSILNNKTPISFNISYTNPDILYVNTTEYGRDSHTDSVYSLNLSSNQITLINSELFSNL